MYRKFCDILNKASEFMLALSMAAMLICVFCQVLFRFVLKLPLFWTEESARYLMVFAVFIGCGVGIRRGSHLGFTFLYDRCGRSLQLVMRLISFFGMFCLNAYIVYYGIGIVLRNTYQISAALQIPMWIIYCILPLSSILSCLQIIDQVIELLCNYRTASTKGGNDL
ncbi:MAG: TRAP transporter small permease [Oscillibacter sp.]|jgi:TRAP-type C4-dicarboxylate transport system permease small subunit|nr:TRAP transporter small permease [Oscillibacter sp.]